LGADRKSDYEPSTIFIQSKTATARSLRVDQRMLFHVIVLLDQLRSLRDIVWIVMRVSML